MPALRDAVASRVDGQGRPRRVENAGLALDRYLREAVGTDKNNTALQNLYRAVADAPPPALYRTAYERWVLGLDDLHAPDVGAWVARAAIPFAGRLIVGLGGESVRETAITLHRLYGVPFLPGTALKGLAHRYAAHLARSADDTALPADHLAILYGTTAGAGYLTYFDAWYIPSDDPKNDKEDRPLARDVITVHHPRYYGSKGKERAPWDFDDPTPVPFLSARGTYLVAVQGPTERWAALGLRLLRRALADWGIGGKTASGYGRATSSADGSPAAAGAPQGDATPAPPLLSSQARGFVDRAQQMRPQDVAGQLRNVYEAARRLAPEERRAVFIAVRDRLAQAQLLSPWANDRDNPKRDWVRDLLAALEG